MLRHLATAALLLALSLLAFQPVVAQAPTTGSMVVTMVNEVNGEAAPLSVCLSGPRQICANSTLNGVSTFNGLPPGDYQVDAQGFGDQGLGQVTVFAGETADVRLSVGFPVPERVRALVSANIRRNPDGSLVSPVVPVRTILRNETNQAANGVTLHMTGPGGSQLQDCYVSGPGDDPCRRGQNNTEAQWLVGAMPAGAQRGPFIAEFTAGAGGVAGVPGFAWYTWQAGGQSQSYSVTLGVAGPPQRPAAGGGTLTVLPIVNGQPVGGMNLIINAAESSGAAVTDANGRAVFSGLTPGEHFVQAYGPQGRGFARVTILAGGGPVTLRMGVLPEFATEFPLADGPLIAPLSGPAVNIQAFTINRALPGGSPGLDNVTQVIVENNGQYDRNDRLVDQTVTGVSVRVTGPAATRFQGCNPACRQVQVPDASAVQFAVGRLDPFSSSNTLSSTFSGGTASAGNLGPNTVTVTFTVGGRQQTYSINLGQGIAR